MAIGMLEILIDRDRCMGSGNCVFWAPRIFELDDGGLSVVVDPEGDEEAKAYLAEEGCPTRAISVRPCR
ncbi:MAG: ferredoxin [Acidimicrobiales bacterium]